MNENVEVICQIYKDCDASISSLTTLINDLNGKDNKIKETVHNIFEGYKRYLKTAEKMLASEKAEPEKMGLIPKMMAKMGVDKEVRKDNSDASIAGMLIQGIQMGELDIEKKLKQFEKNLDNKIVKFAKAFREFQEDNIEKLKSHL